jgi:hypothetical protein
MTMPRIFKSDKFWLALSGAVAIGVSDWIPAINQVELTNIIYLIVATIIGLSVEEYVNK